MIPFDTLTEPLATVEMFAVAKLSNPDTVFATVNTCVASPILPVKISLLPSGRVFAEPYGELSVAETLPVKFEI